MRLVPGRGNPATSTTTRVRPDGRDGTSIGIGVSTSIGTNGIRYAATDARTVRMPVEHPFTVAVTVRTAMVDIVISSDKRIPAI